MIPLLIGIFLIILFIVFVVLSASTWRGWHVAAACLTFLAAVGLVIVGSMTQKTHVKWKNDFSKMTNDLSDEKLAGLKLEIGDPTMVKGDEPSLIEVQTRLNQLLVDRGRVWRRCVAPNPPANNRIAISTVPMNDDGSLGDPNTAAENGINPNMILYGFREMELPLPEGGKMFVPIAFLGEFLVVDAQPTEVTLTPTMPLDRQQVSLVGDIGATWALYEMMPLDSHRVFSNQDTVGQPLDNTTDQAIFGDMDAQKIRQMFAATTGLAPDNDIVSQLVDAYAKNGYAATPQDLSMYPENIWQKLEFEKDRKDELDDEVDSPTPDMGTESNFFDRSGKAVASRLRRGDEASFRANDIGVFPYGHDEDKEWVDGRVADGTCRKIGPIFIRSLRDYEEAFHDIRERLVKRMEDTRRAQRDISNLQAAISDTQQQTAYRQGEREKLKEDQSGFVRDNEKMDQLVTALEQQKETISSELADLYATNLALTKQLAIYNARVAEEINRRAANLAVQ